MASVGGGNQKGGKRSLDTEINLVPFIDLLSMCICFLLMTAVWIQMQVVQVKQARGTEAAAPTGPYELKIAFTGATSLDFLVDKEGKPFKRLLLTAGSKEELARQLEAALNLLAPQSEPAGTPSLISSAMITPNASAPYSNLVTVMDILRQHQIVNLGVVPKRG